jgi:hypothetical protein
MRNLLLKRRDSGCPVHRLIDEMIDLMGETPPTRRAALADILQTCAT